MSRHASPRHRSSSADRAYACDAFAHPDYAVPPQRCPDDRLAGPQRPAAVAVEQLVGSLDAALGRIVIAQREPLHGRAEGQARIPRDRPIPQTRETAVRRLRARVGLTRRERAPEQRPGSRRSTRGDCGVDGRAEISMVLMPLACSQTQQPLGAHIEAA